MKPETQKQNILKLLKESRKAFTLSEIAKSIGMNRTDCYTLVIQLLMDGKIKKYGSDIEGQREVSLYKFNEEYSIQKAKTETQLLRELKQNLMTNYPEIYTELMPSIEE